MPFRRPEIDLSLSLKEGPGMVELVNEGFSHVKDTFQNVEQRIGLQPKQQNDKKFPELKFRSLRLKKACTFEPITGRKCVGINQEFCNHFRIQSIDEMQRILGIYHYAFTVQRRRCRFPIPFRRWRLPSPKRSRTILICRREATFGKSEV